MTPTTPRRTRAKSWRWAAPAVFAMAAVVVIVIIVRSPGGGGGPDGLVAMGPVLELEIARTSGVRRGDAQAAAVDDKLKVRAELDGAGELRVYNGADVEVARCAEAAPDCSVVRSGKRTALSLTTPLRSRGQFLILLFSAPLGSPSAGLDADVAAAEAAGIAITRRPVRVD
jgi:hypothetical protein